MDLYVHCLGLISAAELIYITVPFCQMRCAENIRRKSKQIIDEEVGKQNKEPVRCNICVSQSQLVVSQKYKAYYCTLLLFLLFITYNCTIYIYNKRRLPNKNNSNKTQQCKLCVLVEGFKAYLTTQVLLLLLSRCAMKNMLLVLPHCLEISHH